MENETVVLECFRRSYIYFKISSRFFIDLYADTVVCLTTNSKVRQCIKWFGAAASEDMHPNNLSRHPRQEWHASPAWQWP